MQTQLELFYFAACPYCQLVLHKLRKHQLEIPLRDTRNDPQSRAKLSQDTGKTQVPCLYINNRPMFESSDICDWIDDHLDEIAHYKK